MNQLKNKLAIIKWHISLGYGTLGIFGIGLVIAKTMQDILYSINIGVPMIYLYPAGVLILWATGYIYDRSGMYSAEGTYGCERNEFMKGLKKEEKK